ncbi:MAG: S-methyl-5-thioribose-1-phosphate isomerase [Eubacterium sp.]|nr:S-methyl-5-thioribose-1-phosphate isomerase [Eubacterium sp.]
MKDRFDFEVVDLDDADSALVIIDQTKLPNVTEFLHLHSQTEIWDAIYRLQVRGAPAIGVAAAFGIYLAAKEIISELKKASDGKNFEFIEFSDRFKKASDYLNSSRPTAVNLSWALKRMGTVVSTCKGDSPDEVISKLKAEAYAIKQLDEDTNLAIGENALSLLSPCMGLLTHCNAGFLATTRYGTATAAMYLGQERGYGFHVYCDETRPLLQGARLTAWELSRSGIQTTLLCDNMAPSLMREGKIDAVFVGCDRVAANGDTANKIGTSYVALAAARFGIPFYVCAPSSTIDGSIPNGEAIPIEQRDGSEVTESWYERRMAPEGIDVYNPAFDVTPASDITAIITEKGIFRGPYDFTQMN